MSNVSTLSQMEKKFHKLLKKENAALEQHFLEYGDMPEPLLAMADEDFPDQPQYKKKVIPFTICCVTVMLC